MVLLQLGAELGEARRELPVAEDRRVVQHAGLAAQGRQIVESGRGPSVCLLEHREWVATTWPSRHDHDPVDVALDRHHLERERAGHAVTVGVEGDGLVLVHGDGGADHAGVEPVLRQRRRRGEILGEAVLDRERAEERLDDPLPLGLAPFAKESCSIHRGPRPGARAWRTGAARP